MGRPVRIDDLARRMISLIGVSVRDSSNPDGDIEITYTGLRSAEKLFEELLIGSNVTQDRSPDDHARNGALDSVGSHAGDSGRPLGRLGRASIVASP